MRARPLPSSTSLPTIGGIAAEAPQPERVAEDRGHRRARGGRLARHAAAAACHRRRRSRGRRACARRARGTGSASPRRRGSAPGRRPAPRAARGRPGSSRRSRRTTSVDCCCRSRRSGGENGQSFTLRARSSPQISTSRCALAYGSGRSSTALTTLKIAVQAPMPSAIVTVATVAKPRFLRSPRAA